MILDLKGIVKKYNLNINGVIHCGGHYGEEYDTYLELGINNQVWFEPQPEVFKIMESKLPNNENIKLINKALGNDLNYTPDTYKRISELDETRDITEPVFNPDNRKSVYDKESRVLIPASQPKTLPKGRVLSFSFVN